MKNFTFQQDNDQKHTSKYTNDFFISKNFTILEWPANSPDLNPIEHLWAYIKDELSKIQITSKTHLIEKVKEIWYAITPERCERLVNSMRNRIKLVIKA